jgi:deazaflavin-dependent oxidoreductase (nitroreductase family)
MPDIKNRGAAPPRWILKIITRVHALISALSGGRWGNTINGDEVCFVDMVGARTGRTRTIPLMYVPRGDQVLLVASMGGAPKNPTWYHNLVKNPEVEISYRGKRSRYRTRLATPDEKPDMWPVCDQAYAPFADYRKLTSRDIPIFVCDPL